MKRDLELRRLEWRDLDDPKRVVVATLAWCPTDRANGRQARYVASLYNVRREPVCHAGKSYGFWESGSPYEVERFTLVSIPKGSRRCKLWESKALARFEAFVADYLPEYASRYNINVDVDAPSTTR